MTTKTLAREDVKKDVADQQSDQQSLIPPCRHKALLMKLNSFKVNNLNSRDGADYDMLVKKTSYIFTRLCWYKLGVSLEQLKKLEQQELSELAAIIYRESRLFGLIQFSILVFIPIIGWLILMSTLNDVSSTPEKGDGDAFYQNMRYHWWYRRMKNKYGRDFEPKLNNM